jgi:hypothetical protein
MWLRSPFFYSHNLCDGIYEGSKMLKGICAYSTGETEETRKHSEIPFG